MKKGQKLTDEELEMVRQLVGYNQYELAKRFGVTQSRISQIQSGYGRKEVDIWGDKKARTIASRLRRSGWDQDTAQKIGKRSKKRRKDWATRKTSQDFEKTLALRKANPKWVRSVEQFKEYHKRPDAMYHAKLNALKTHCKRRHPLTGSNVYVHFYKGRAMRQCLICFSAYQKARYAKKNAKREADRLRGR